MIVKNDFVKIKNKNKETILKNYIYDKYLETICSCQYTYNNFKFGMTSCFLKFNVPFDNIENKTINDFDVEMSAININISSAESKIETNYSYIPEESNFFNVDGTNANVSDYINKKITAIGFGGWTLNDETPYYVEEIFSCVDTSYYSIYFEENMNFERKDIFTTDTIATDGVPYHLKPYSDDYYIFDSPIKIRTPKYPILYSVGFGKIKGQMEEEYVIGEDIDIIQESPTSFGFNLKRGLENNKYPKQSLYAKSSLFPLPLNITRESNPNTRLYTGSGIVPMSSDYKYIIYKYRFWVMDMTALVPNVLNIDEYFTINLPNDTKGLFEIVTKIERSDV